jgi:hypothetical protein
MEYNFFGDKNFYKLRDKTIVAKIPNDRPNVIVLEPFFGLAVVDILCGFV